jgi:hypothetical protein
VPQFLSKNESFNLYEEDVVMMIRFRNIIIILVVTGCIAVPLSSLSTGLAQEDEDEPVPIHIITGTHDEARVRRDGWSGFSNLSLGASLQFGDLIDPGEETIIILCADLTEHAVTQLDAVPCSQERSVLMQEGQSMAGWQRGAIEDITIPFLIAPRATIVLTAQPLIRWNPIPSVEGYRVIVRGDDLRWSADVADPEIHKLLYPDDAPSLVPGASYTIEVIAVTAGEGEVSSNDEDVSGVSFTIMAEDEVEAIETTIAEIHASIDDENIASLVDVRFYTQNNLFAEAVQTLLPISGDLLDTECPTKSAVSQSPVVYLILGELYLRTQLERYAAIAYDCALDLAAIGSDLESQALAATALARLTLDEDDQAEYVALALDLWEQLGADVRIEALRQEFGR